MTVIHKINHKRTFWSCCRTDYYRTAISVRLSNTALVL